MLFLRSAGIFLGFILLLAACRSSSSSETTPVLAVPAQTQLTGRQLAQTYCGSCHVAPDPSLLDKATWQNGVLPQMALRMGQTDRQMTELARITDVDELMRVIAARTFPENPTLHPADWQKIVRYYTREAPDKPLPQSAHPAPQPTLPLFRARLSDRAIDGLVTLLQYDSVTHRIWAGDGRGQLYVLDQHLQRIDSVHLSSPATDLRVQNDGSFDVLTVGDLDPNDRLTGTWSHQARMGEGLSPQLENLQRPVQATPVDLNRDGREDMVICQFGHHIGKLTWHERLSGSRQTGSLLSKSRQTSYREHLIDAMPGVRLALVRDVNQDGWPDVVALLTQGDEQVAVYYNRHDGSFRKEVVLRFPPVYGSSYLELADMDRDGDLDLIYTNGDNADYSKVPKRYHGVRIFRNDGRFRFRQEWFYPMHGATQTVVGDFDQDGDIDIAAIAHFPVYASKSAESFVYFENQGNGHLLARTFPTADRGRWLRMDAGDVDQDGDTDILLGSFFRSADNGPPDLTKHWRKPGAGILLLENKLK